MDSRFLNITNERIIPEWGKARIEDFLRNLYKGKNFLEMSKEEADQMFDDLI